MTLPKTNPENHRGNGKYFRNRRAPSPCGDWNSSSEGRESWGGGSRDTASATNPTYHLHTLERSMCMYKSMADASNRRCRLFATLKIIAPVGGLG